MNSNFMSLVPVILHTVVVMLLNSIYRYVAEWLTDLENHRFEHQHENSLIIKRFLFEAFDCYLPLFYIAFFEQCIIKLRGEMIALFTADQFRRVLTEALIPYLMQLWASRGEEKKTALDKKNDADVEERLLARELAKVTRAGYPGELLGPAY